MSPCKRHPWNPTRNWGATVKQRKGGLGMAVFEPAVGWSSSFSPRQRLDGVSFGFYPKVLLISSHWLLDKYWEKIKTGVIIFFFFRSLSSVRGQDDCVQWVELAPHRLPSLLIGNGSTLNLRPILQLDQNDPSFISVRCCCVMNDQYGVNV